MIVWALFDSGNGCYKQAVEKYFNGELEVYSIGIDIENKNHHFLHLNLADYSELFGKSELYQALDKLPTPDILLASPPCESWSIASSIKRGNVCWYTEELNTLFGVVEATNHFTLRTKEQLEQHFEKTPYFKKHWWKTVYNRINGELCAFNIIRIIERYKPHVWVIENPQSSRLWRYYRQIQNFHGIANVAHYNAYDKSFLKKPTTFYSNIPLNLKTTPEPPEVTMHSRVAKATGRPMINSYNERSNILLPLIRDILMKCIRTITPFDYKSDNLKRLAISPTEDNPFEVHDSTVTERS